MESLGVGKLSNEKREYVLSIYELWISLPFNIQLIGQEIWQLVPIARP